MECQACAKDLNKTDLLKCVTCGGAYHYMCLSMSTAYYMEHQHKLKKTWRCPPCENVTSRRKGGDTPVRQQFLAPESTLDMSCDDFNVHEASVTKEPPVKGRERPSEVITYQQFALLLDSRLEIMKASLTKQFRNDLIDALETLKSDFSATTDFLSSQICELKQEVTTYESKFKDIEDENQKLRQSVSQLQLELNNKEQSSLSNDVQITGIPESENESLTHIIKTVAAKIGVNLHEQDIASVARAGPKRATAEPSGTSHSFRSRPIVVRLMRRATRDELLRNARARRGANTAELGLPAHEPKRFYINERLTKTNRQVFNKAREAARISKWRFVWTKEGRVYARRSETSEVHSLHTEADVDKIFSGTRISHNMDS